MSLLLEAFVGAMFLDLGFDAARKWFVNAMEQHIDIVDYIQKLLRVALVGIQMSELPV